MGKPANLAKGRFNLPKVVEGQVMKLNLGCGKDYKQGWVNIDAVAEVEPDIVHDLRKKLPFKTGQVSEILAQDILEHFTREELEPVLVEISRVLKSGGQLTIRVPNLDDIIDRFAGDKETRNQFIYGTTKDTGVFGAHKVGFTPQFLVAVMLENHLELISFIEEDTNFIAKFTKKPVSQPLNKLTIFVGTMGLGGAENFILDLADYLNQQKIKITIISNFTPFLKMAGKRGLKTEPIPYFFDVIGDWKGLVKSLIFLPPTLLAYLQIIWKFRSSDLFLLVGFPEKILGSWLIWFFNRPQAWIEFGPLASLKNKFFHLPEILYRIVKNLPHKVIVPSKNTQQHLMAEVKHSLAKLEIIPCGIRRENFKKFTHKEINLKKPIVVCVSRLEAGKGQDLLIKSWSQVLRKNSQAQLIIVGEGGTLHDLQTLVDKLNITDKVFFLGRVESALAVMKAADVCVFPSRWDLEGFGLTVIEVMFLTKPIIAFDRAPANELIKNNVDGLLVEDGNAKALANAINKLLAKPKLRQKLSKAAHKKFNINYTIDKVGEQYLQVLNRAVYRQRAKQKLQAIN